jgi:hypothetical protein
VADPVAALGYVFQGTAAEVEDLFLPLGTVPEPLHPGVATFFGISADRAYISGCQGSVGPPGGMLGCNRPSGVHDLLAVEDRDLEPTAVLFRSGAWVFENGASDLGLFDFGSSRAFVPEDHVLTVHEVPRGLAVAAEGGLRLRAGSEVLDYTFPGFGQFPSVDGLGDMYVPIRLVPQAHLGPEDVEFVTVRWNDDVTTISHSEWFGETGDRTMTFPSRLLPGFDTSVAPPSRVGVRWSPAASLLLYTMNARTDDVSWVCAVSRGWLSDPSHEADYVLPDFHALAGWSPALAFRGPSVDVAFRADSYVDVKRSLTFALYGKRLVPPPWDTTQSLTSVLKAGVTVDVP